jgi:(p)ppGpp synthase/HD superfamily hydrolase
MQFKSIPKNARLTNAFSNQENQHLKSNHLKFNQSKLDQHFNISSIENFSQEFLSLDFRLIYKAIQYAKTHHGAQRRQTGELYYRHPLSVADVAVNYFCETNVVLCSILHDTLEDTKLTQDEIKKEFNATTLNCVILLTNKKNENLEQRINHILDNTYKLKPPRTDRTLLIKLADRLHNMQSLHVKTKEKQQRIAAETIDILLPIAKNLELFGIHDELSLLCEKYK